MAKQVLFIHGGGGGAFEADGALAASLCRELGDGAEVDYPEMPNEEEPDYQTWKRIIWDKTRVIGESAVLVGHSIGASVLIKMLTEPESKPPLSGVFAIAAPFWHDDDFWRWDKVKLAPDAAEHLPPSVPLFLYHGEADEFVPVSHLDMYAKALPQATIKRLPGRNHQLNENMAEIARDIRALSDQAAG